LKFQFLISLIIFQFSTIIILV